MVFFVFVVFLMFVVSVVSKVFVVLGIRRRLCASEERNPNGPVRLRVRHW